MNVRARSYLPCLGPDSPCPQDKLKVGLAFPVCKKGVDKNTTELKLSKLPDVFNIFPREARFIMLSPKSSTGSKSRMAFTVIFISLFPMAPGHY